MERSADRIAVGVEYNGAFFHGWQRQLSPDVATVQRELENALAKVADHSVTLACAGRTDAGVHALNQVAHFDADNPRPLDAWIRGANSHLPPQVRVRWAHEVSGDFHARHSALARRYRYVICNAPLRPAIFHGLQTHVHAPLDAQLMHAEAQALLGEQDFSAFRASACQSRTPMRNVHHARVARTDDRVMLDIQANAFLLHMVRNIVGALIEVGCGRQRPGWIAELLAGRDRRLAAPTASPAGLYFVDALYPPGIGLPQCRDDATQFRLP